MSDLHLVCFSVIGLGLMTPLLLNRVVLIVSVLLLARCTGIS